MLNAAKITAVLVVEAREDLIVAEQVRAGKQLLRRLETQGLLTSEWREEDKRKKRFYRLSADGAAVLEQLLVEWNGINKSLHNILKLEETR